MEKDVACGRMEPLRVSTHLQAPRHRQPPPQRDPTAKIYLAVSAHKARQQSDMATGVEERELLIHAGENFPSNA